MTNKIDFHIYNPSQKDDYQKIAQMIQQTELYSVVDEIDSQLDELFLIRNPTLKEGEVSQEEKNRFIKSLSDGRDLSRFGTWVYFPWKKTIVHFLPEDIHTELRTARNRNLITKKEQDIYYSSHIGIAGLSVGNSAVGTILHTGGGKYMKLADHDILSVTNINRIRTGFDNVGLKKVEIATREIMEVNPYANIQTFPDGLTEHNLESFVLSPKPLDILIEEMDNIYLKIQVRLLARKHRIPVIMVTDNGDNVVLDVERFDLEPNYPLLHGDVPESELEKVSLDTPKPEAARIISRWVKPENIAPRMKDSLLELGRTLYSWPQLGTAAFLAGCTLAYTARKILVGENIKSGKYFISFDEAIDTEYLSEEQKTYRKQQTESFKKLLHLE